MVVCSYIERSVSVRNGKVRSSNLELKLELSKRVTLGNDKREFKNVNKAEARKKFVLKLFFSFLNAVDAFTQCALRKASTKFIVL